MTRLRYFMILLFLGAALLHLDCNNNLSANKFEDVNLTYADTGRVLPKGHPFAKKLDTLQAFADKMGGRLNGTMIIAIHDTVLVERAFGYLEICKDPTGYGGATYNDLAARKRREENKMTLNTLFDLASVSKQFTAAAILKLCSEDKIHLTDSLCSYYPNTPYKNVTIKQLLTHTSGIPEYFTFDYSVYGNSAFVTNKHLMSVLDKQRYPIMFRRGSQFKYVNTNYAILADLVAKVSGMAFEDYVRENLWKPAGMKNTRFFTEIVGVFPEDKLQYPSVGKGLVYLEVGPMEGTADCPIARGHWRNAALAPYDRLNGILGDKGVYSNVEDMVKWTNAFFIEARIVPREWVDQAMECQNVLSNGKTPDEMYGYGVRMEEKPGHGKTIYHGGLWNGFHNVWLYRPSDGLQILFLSNYYNRAHIGCCDKLLEILDN